MLPDDAIIEAILFVAPVPTAVARIASVLSWETRRVEAALEALASSLASRGLRLQRHGDRVQLVTASEAAPVVEAFLGVNETAKLSSAAIETLAVVAYRQPVTRAQIEAVRGVNSDRAVATLIAHGLIEEVGRADTIGRPALFAATFEFLEHFGLCGFDDLPPLPDPTP